MTNLEYFSNNARWSYFFNLPLFGFTWVHLSRVKISTFYKDCGHLIYGIKVLKGYFSQLFCRHLNKITNIFSLVVKDHYYYGSYSRFAAAPVYSSCSMCFNQCRFFDAGVIYKIVHFFSWFTWLGAKWKVDLSPIS